MPIALLEEIKRQKVLVLVAGAALLILLVVWFGILIRGAKEPEGLVVPSRSEKLEIDFSILENPSLRELTVFDEILIPAEIGRENPFLPYLREQKTR